MKIIIVSLFISCFLPTLKAQECLNLYDVVEALVLSGCYSQILRNNEIGDQWVSDTIFISDTPLATILVYQTRTGNMTIIFRHKILLSMHDDLAFYWQIMNLERVNCCVYSAELYPVVLPKAKGGLELAKPQKVVVQQNAAGQAYVTLCEETSF